MNFTDEECREWWRANGGNMERRIVELGVMPERLLLPFIRRLLQSEERIQDLLSSNVTLRSRLQSRDVTLAKAQLQIRRLKEAKLARAAVGG